MTKETNKTPGSIPVQPNRAALPMMALTVPILLETLFRVLVSSVDTIMLSTYSQEAVAGAGMIAQYIFFVQIMFNVICIGTSIVLAQYLGGKRMDEARHVAQASAIMILIAGLVISAGIIVGAKPLLDLYSIDPDVRSYAWQYLVIFGGFGSLFMAFSMLQGTILRAYGYTKDAMYVAMAANVINVIGNALSLYGFFGIPVLGVVGVAASSVLSQIAACFLLVWRIKKHPDIQFDFRGITKIPSVIYKTILSIGVPTAGENMAYNLAQIVIMAMVSTLGTFAMSGMIYTQTIARFVFVVSMSIGNAVQIKIGYFVGAKQSETAYRRLYTYQIIGTLFSVGLILLINLFKTPIIGMFTDVPEIAAITSTLLIFSIYIETGRSMNLIAIPALKGAGDVKFPVLYGLASMWGIMVAGAWFFGIKAHFGLIGIWLAIGTDETLRGIAMLLRWKSKRWQTKALR